MLKLTRRLQETDVQHNDELLLPFDERKRGRLKATTQGGRAAGIFIERGDVLRGGTLLQADSGEVVLIRASDEEVTTASCENALTFAKACYHLGNRHVPLQIGNNWLRFQKDHVLDEMVMLLGLTVDHTEAPFEPENGAYAKGHGHHHGEHSHEPVESHEH
ncbi:urease accessory protein UreE [Endozoicomonas sp. 8E]|uniref:urease accessory protein UreE n=1 Tax=Endozoicomonas sp. 8E TaxID=3035692 RepID=UPI0029390CE4|nr:urease accessory protein UreE [Endozoicomonas sp. 8E]WOG28674.1 urease accessory protein UreE [Endozoicomonas sp. 8E]